MTRLPGAPHLEALRDAGLVPPHDQALNLLGYYLARVPPVVPDAPTPAALAAVLGLLASLEVDQLQAAADHRLAAADVKEEESQDPERPESTPALWRRASGAFLQELAAARRTQVRVGWTGAQHPALLGALARARAVLLDEDVAGDVAGGEGT